MMIRRIVKAAAIATGAVAVALFAVWPMGYRWNGSPSLPRGLYATAARSDLRSSPMGRRANSASAAIGTR